MPGLTNRSDPLPVVAVILAAGSGVRLRSTTPKQLMQLAGKPVLAHTVRAFENTPAVDEILVVTRDDLVETSRRIIAQEGAGKVSRVLVGGATRRDSTRAALAALSSLGEAKVLIHDAVRPLIERHLIEEVIRSLDEADAVTVAIPPADTIIEVAGNHISSVPPRAGLRHAQTPQGFRLSVLADAHDRGAAEPESSATDDCGIVHRYRPDVRIRVIDGSLRNLKLTQPTDFYVAETILRSSDVETQPVETADSEPRRDRRSMPGADPPG